MNKSILIAIEKNLIVLCFIMLAIAGNNIPAMEECYGFVIVVVLGSFEINFYIASNSTNYPSGLDLNYFVHMMLLVKNQY